MNDIQLILKAASFAAEKHRMQRRKDVEASPYINHPLALADIISNEGGVDDVVTICAALLHDTVEDTETSIEELEREFGKEISLVVDEVTDDKTLPKLERKRLQIEHAATSSYKAKMVKLADKICNLRDVAACPPEGWSLERKREYFDWSKAVIEQLRGTNVALEQLFDRAYEQKP